MVERFSLIELEELMIMEVYGKKIVNIIKTFHNSPNISAISIEIVPCKQFPR